jgi:hypothetical protein
VEKVFYFLGTHCLMENFLSGMCAILKEKLKFWGVLKEKKSVIAENMYKYNIKIGILENLLVLFLVTAYILLNHVKKSQNKLICLIFSVTSNNFWEHCSRVP